VAGELAPVVNEPDCGEAAGDHQHQPDELVGEVGEQQGRQHQRREDEHAAHGRRARLGEMALGPSGADVLADLGGGQLAD
jgi:hypothetical protein